jgi:hypothetical protein
MIDKKEENISYPAVIHRFCAFASPADGWCCTEPVWSGSKHGYCIGHAQEPHKPATVLLNLVQKKIKATDFTFDGFIFPYRLRIKNLKMNATVSFMGCTFHKGFSLENIQFNASITTFAHSTFLDSHLYFNHCHFKGKNFSFHNSLFHGDVIAFNACSFKSDITDFSNSQWQADKAIAFLRCSFAGNNISFDSAELDAPIISFKGGGLHASHIHFKNARIQSKTCAFQNLQQTKGALLFDGTKFTTDHLKFTANQWNGNKIHFYKTLWNGGTFQLGTDNEIKENLLFDHCRLNGQHIDLSKLTNHGNLAITNSVFEAKGDIDLTSMTTHRTALFHNSTFTSHRLLLDKIESNGDTFAFQNNRVDTDLFSCVNAHFKSKRVSFNRTQIHAQKTDFSRSVFENMQTSFKAMKVEGESAEYKDVHFQSRHVSFNLSSYLCGALLFDNANFHSAVVSFWKTDFGPAHVSLLNTVDNRAVLHFSCNLSNLHLFGANLRNCDFGASTWATTGLVKRPIVADEPLLLQTCRFSELQELYQWIALQYHHCGNKKKQKDFLYALHEIQKLERKYQGRWSEFLKLELSKWITGYGLGVSRVGLIKGTTALCAATFPLFTKLR